jgi:hypothetical protein
VVVAGFFKTRIMAFAIKRSDNGVITWNIPNEKPFDSTTIEWLQADGDELEYVKRRFDNIPYSHGICHWHGEMAQFIYNNL